MNTIHYTKTPFRGVKINTETGQILTRNWAKIFKLQFWSLLEKQTLDISGITLGNLNLNHLAKHPTGTTTLVAVRFSIPRTHQGNVNMDTLNIVKQQLTYIQPPFSDAQYRTQTGSVVKTKLETSVDNENRVTVKVILNHTT